MNALLLLPVVLLFNPAPSPAPPAAGGVRAVDWANRAYPTDGGPQTLKDGHWEVQHEEDGFGESLELNGVQFGDLDGDGKEEAVVGLKYWGGGTGRFDTVTIYRAGKDGPEVVADIAGGDRGDGGIASTRIEQGAVLVERMLSLPGDGACCPSLLITERWTLKGGKAVEDPAPVRITAFSEPSVKPPAEAELAAGREASRAGDADTAVRRLLDGLAAKPNDPTILGELGFAMVKAGWPEEAAIVLSAVGASDGPPKVRAAALYNLGQMQVGAGKAAEAAASFEQSLKLRPGNAATEKALAEARAQIPDTAPKSP